MAKAFSLTSRDVEHLKGKPEHVGCLVQLLQDQIPDVFGPFEVAENTVIDGPVTEMRGYQFHMSEVLL